VSITRGIGKTAQDWSYLTATRALFVQGANITDPSLINDLFIIDTATKRDGGSGERGHQQTIVIHATAFGVTTVTPATAKLLLWIDSSYADTACEHINESSSSANSLFTCPAYPTLAEIGDTDKWALIEVGMVTNALTASSSMCFSFPWMPAGRYKAALGVGITSGTVLISEQHTE